MVDLAHVAGLDDSPTLVRVRSRIRWWCTALVSSSDGIGAISASLSRSESTISRAPAAIASLTSRRIRSIASRSAGAAAGDRIEALDDAAPRSPAGRRRR